MQDLIRLSYHIILYVENTRISQHITFLINHYNKYFFVIDSKILMYACFVNQYLMFNVLKLYSNHQKFCNKVFVHKKKIVTIPSELVKIIIVAYRGDTRVNILQVRSESSKDNRLFFIIMCQTLNIGFLLLILCYFPFLFVILFLF